MRLAHCPFCGEEERLRLAAVHDGSEHTYCVVCDGCGVRGSDASSISGPTAKSTAINSWNNRLSHHDDLALRVAFALTETATGPGA